MAWNEPGGSGPRQRDDKDPKKAKEKENDIWNRRRPDSPPNLDEFFGKLLRSLKNLLGVKAGRSSTGKPVNFVNFTGVAFAILIMLILWAISGIYIVGPSEQGVILRFGKYVDTVNPGPHWLMRFIEQKYIVNVSLVQSLDYSAKMLTRDTNIVDVEFTIRYRVNNAKDFLFNVVNPKGTLEQATASTVRQVIGQSYLDAVISSDREKVQDEVESILKSTMALYQSGLSVSQVTFQSANPPQEVIDAFDDVTKAKEDEKRYIKEAETYAANILPIAQGQATQIVTIAKANQQQTILEAQGNVASYLALLPEYKKSPAVMQTRLYLDALQAVFEKTTKVLLDTGNSSVVYLPLDKMANAASTVANNNTVPNVPYLPLPPAAMNMSNNVPSPSSMPNSRFSSNSNNSGRGSTP